MQIERGMVGREIERGKVVPLSFRFRAERNGEAELAEDVVDLFNDQRDRMLGAKPLATCRHRKIHVLFGRASGVELASAIIERSFELCLDGIDQRAAFPQLSRRKSRQLLEQFRKPA